MIKNINALIIEDSKASLNLMLAVLKKSGFSVAYEQVSDAGGLRDALSRKNWDIILSDHVMPDFSSVEALDIVNGLKVDAPFIIVSGGIDEELAVQAMRSGCRDYIMKDKISRLGPAVMRELEEAGRKREDRRIQEALFKNLLKSKEEAEAANKAKSLFIANMSHEIRTPLNGITGMLELTMKEPLSDEQKDNLLLAKNCAESLMYIFNELLDFSKIEAGRMSLTEITFSLRELLNRLFRLNLHKARNKGLTLNLAIDHDVPDNLIGDSIKIQQVLNNLIQNAVKFTVKGTVSIVVSCKEISSYGAIIEFTVTDTGIGIDGADMDKLFTSFSRINESYTREYGGTGLGLAISKQLVELMGGTILADSVKGSGSTFRFALHLGIVSFAETTGDNYIPLTDIPENTHINDSNLVLELIEAILSRGERDKVRILQDTVNNSAYLSSYDQLVNLVMRLKICIRRNDNKSAGEAADEIRKILLHISGGNGL